MVQELKEKAVCHQFRSVWIYSVMRQEFRAEGLRLSCRLKGTWGGCTTLILGSCTTVVTLASEVGTNDVTV